MMNLLLLVEENNGKLYYKLEDEDSIEVSLLENIEY